MWSASPYLSSELVFDPFHSRAVIEYRVHKRVKEQFDAFMAGFSELIPQDLVNVFDERELEVSVSSKPRRISDRLLISYLLEECPKVCLQVSSLLLN